MAFVQIMDLKTDNIDELRALDEEWEKATEGRRTVRRSIITQDRNDPSRHVLIVFFDSYESAMENSKLPETQELAQKTAALVNGAMSFSDLDVIDDRS